MICGRKNYLNLTEDYSHSFHQQLTDHQTHKAKTTMILATSQQKLRQS